MNLDMAKKNGQKGSENGHLRVTFVSDQSLESIQESKAEINFLALFVEACGFLQKPHFR